MRYLGLPVAVGDEHVVQFTRTADGRIIPMRLAVCLPDKKRRTVLFFDGDDCGHHFRWATPADLPVTCGGDVAA